MAPQPIITLTTDFGVADPYAASMKGVILSLNPHATIVDVSHSVRPQRIEQAAFLLEMALPYFPPTAIHLAIVDPGVGTPRRAIALQTPVGTFVGPDNGILSAAIPAGVRRSVGEPGGRATLVDDLLGVSLTNPRYHREPVSDTFHGRDIFAPAAAHLSLGVPLPDLGELTDEIFVLPSFRARERSDGSLAGRVVHIDRFGNLITDIREEDLVSRGVAVTVAGRRIQGIQRTYAAGRGLAALVGGSGFLEIALAGGNAAAELGADIGEPVALRYR